MKITPDLVYQPWLKHHPIPGGRLFDRQLQVAIVHIRQQPAILIMDFAKILIGTQPI